MEIDIALINEVPNETSLEIEEMYHELMDIVVELEGINENLELSVLLVDEVKIRNINATYRHKDSVTDVISFALEDEQDFVIEGAPRNLGDIFICAQRAKDQAVEYGHSLEREMAFLFVHGILHLLGYDHIQADDEACMIKKQNLILSTANIERRT